MSHSGPAKFFQKLRYGVIARSLAKVNSRHRFTGSPEFRPVVVPAIEKATVVSVSPHPDDDVIAVGGALAGHVLAGGESHSVILTDGRRGTDTATSRNGLDSIRNDETRQAAEILNLTSISFWNEPDGQLVCSDRLVEDFIAVIKTHRPDFVYTPFPLDYHFDHIQSTAMVVKALSSLGEPPTIRCYESIIPLIPNKIINITDVIDIKRRAVESFHTQNAVSDYTRTIVEGLNRHRSYGQMAGKGYGEAVFETTPDFLAELLEMLHGI